VLPTTTTASTTGAAALKPHRSQRLSLSALYGATVHRSSQVSALVNCSQCTHNLADCSATANLIPESIVKAYRDNTQRLFSIPVAYAAAGSRARHCSTAHAACYCEYCELLNRFARFHPCILTLNVQSTCMCCCPTNYQAAAASSVQLPSFIEQCHSGFDTARTHFSTAATSTPAAVMFTLPVPDAAAALSTLQSWASLDSTTSSNDSTTINRTTAHSTGIDRVRSSSRSNGELQVNEAKLASAPTISVLQCTHHSAVIGWSGAGVAALELFGPQVDAPSDTVSNIAVHNLNISMLWVTAMLCN
jgi:hypothetical protein